MNYNSMVVFTHVVRSESFTRAANELGMPLSTVSRKVSELEADLGIKLLDRTTRSLRLTELGKVYYQHCQQGVDAFNFANQSLRQSRTEEHGMLHISIAPNMAEPLFLPIIKLFQNRYTQANVRVSISERLLDFVEDDLDLSFRVSPPENPKHVAVTLLKHHHAMIASPSYLAANGEPKHPEELPKHSLIGFGLHNQPELIWRLTDKEKVYEHQFVPKLEINDYADVLEAARLGLGIAEVPSILAQKSMAEGKVLRILPHWTFPEITLSAVHQGPQSLSHLARLFLDICKEQFRLKKRELTFH